MKYLVRLIVPILSIITISSCNRGGSKESGKEVIIKADPPLLIAISSHNLGESIQLPGVIEPFEFVQLYPKVSGFVKDVYVDRGSKVKKGAVLLVLDAPEQTEHLAAARLKYTEGLSVLQNSTDRYNRLKETSNTPGTVSPYDLAAARSKMTADDAMVQGALANYKAQQAMCTYLVITAPFDGVITERDVHPGTLVGPGTQNMKPVLVLQQQSKFRLVVNLPEQYSSQVKEGDKVKFRINALPGQEFNGLISRASGSLSDHYRSETVEIDVPNAAGIIKSGMYAEVEIPAVGNTHAFVVPKKAVITTTERKYVIKLDNGVARYADVTLGNQNGDSTEVFGLLKDGDNVVCNASYKIKDGQKL